MKKELCEENYQENLDHTTDKNSKPQIIHNHPRFSLNITPSVILLIGLFAALFLGIIMGNKEVTSGATSALIFFVLFGGLGE